MQRSVYHSQVYDSQSIQAWECRWFAQQNSSLGLMQQAAWTIAQNLNKQFLVKKLTISRSGVVRAIMQVMAII